MPNGAKLMMPPYDLGNGVRQIVQKALGPVGGTFERQTENDSPEEDTDVVGVQNRVDRIGDDVFQQIADHLSHAAWSGKLI